MVLHFFCLCPGSQHFLQGISWATSITCSLQNGFETCIGREGVSAPSQLQRHPALVQGQFWTGDTPGVLWARADNINRYDLLDFSPQLKQCPPGWPLQRGHWYWVPHWLGANIGCEADCVVITEASTGDWVPVSGLPGATLSNHCGDFLPYAVVF